MRNDLRLFLPMLTAWGCTAVLLHQPEPIVRGAVIVSLLLCGSMLVGVAALRFRKQRLTRDVPVVLVMVLLASAMLSAVLIRVDAEQHLRHPALLSEAIQKGSPISFRATATSTPREQNTPFDAQPNLVIAAVVSEVLVNAERNTVSIPVHITVVRDDLGDIGIGSSIEGLGSFSETDRGQSSAYRVRATDIRSTSPPAVLAWAEALRSALRSEAQNLSGWGAMLIPGLAVGDTELVTEQLDAAMKSASLTHLTAVSGANCAIITGLIMLLGKALRLRVWIRVAVALLFLVLFVVLVTPEPSVLRAAVMSLLALGSVLFARQAFGTAALATAMLVLLIVDPWQAVHFGFILSVLATAGIILFTQPITSLLDRWIPHWLAVVIAVPLAAQLACQPAIVLLQPTLPVLGVVANVLAAPAAPIATVTGLVACVLLPIWPVAGAFTTWLTWLPASWIALLAASIAELPFAQLPWIAGWPGVFALATIIAGLLLAQLLPNVVPPGKALRRLVSARLPVLSIALSALVAISIVHPWATRAALPPNWRLYVCDVGQGDAVIIRGSVGTMLIDTGKFPERVAACLDDASVSRIDVLVFTHDDADHVGGASGVLARTQLAIVSPSSEPDNERALLSQLKAGGVPFQTAATGMRGTLGDVNWRVIWPSGASSHENRNDSSVIIRVDTPEFSALFLGDLGQEAQQRLLESRQVAPADVVKVSHHGSSDQHGKLYKHISAEYGIISVGTNNGYGHPTSRALEQLRHAQTVSLRTDLLGAFALARNHDGEWVIWRSAALG